VPNCKCGAPSHPAFGTRCEDCFADDQERATGRLPERPADLPDYQTIRSRALDGRHIWTGIKLVSARPKNRAEIAERIRLAMGMRESGMSFVSIAQKFGVTKQAAMGLIKREEARRAKAKADSVDPREGLHPAEMGA
jgi:hypothetical protein